MSLIYDDKKGGVFSKDQYLMPGPGTIFRRQAILDIITHLSHQFPQLKPNKYLGIGCGVAAIDYEFCRLGYSCDVYDWSIEALNNVKMIYNEDKERLVIKTKLTANDNYDVIGAYEVLEHNRDDFATLTAWSTYLKPDGLIFLSVPARMKYWSAADEASGHYKRYEKQELIQLLHDCGFEIIKILSIGFPFQVILLPLLSRIPYRKKLLNENKTHKIRTLSTGLVNLQLWSLKKFFPFRLFVFFAKFQRLFYKTDWGHSFVVVGQRLEN